MKILITGGFGFLGSHLIDTILKHHPKAEIHVQDNLTSNVVNPRLFTHNKPITRGHASIHRWLKDYKNWDFDQVYHLASPVGPVGVLSKSGTIAKRIIDDAFAVTLAARYWHAKMVFVSTSEVYGGGQEGYCEEDMPKIISPEPSARLEYATGKLAAEVMLLNQAKEAFLDCVIVRPFNIAGMRQSALGGFVLPRFLKAAQDNLPLTVYGDGKQVRAFTDVRDVAEGVYLAMKKGKAGQIYNIGNEANRIQIGDLADMVVRLTGKGKIKHVDPKKLHGELFAEANDKYPNSEKARKELGWKPMYPLGSIILHTIKYMEGEK